MKTISILSIALLIGALTGCSQDSAGETSDGSTDAQRLTVVRVIRPEVRSLKQRTTQPATIQAFQQAEIHARVAGYLKTLKVDIGDEVAENDVLAVLSVPEMERAKDRQLALIKQLEADEKRYEAQKNLAEVGILVADALHEEAKSEISKAVAQLKADELERDRVRGLVADQSVARRVLDEAQKQYESSLAAKTAAEAKLNSAKTQVELAREKLKVAEREWQSAKEATNVARKRLAEMKTLMAFATLTAPFPGIVTERHIDKGDLVRNTQAASDDPRQPLFTLADVRRLRVHVMVPEHEAPLVREGADVRLKLRSLPRETFDEATVTRIAKKLDERTQTMRVEVVVDNRRDGSHWLLMPGMYGEATITLKQKPQAITLPADAVRYDESGHARVYVVEPDDTIRIVSVTTGIDLGDAIEIVSGLDSEARVVGPMVGRLKAGQKVRVTSK